MAAIDNLILGGTGFADSRGISYGSAVSYRLLKPSPLSLIEVIDEWEVQIREGSSTIVARLAKSKNNRGRTTVFL